MQRPLSVGQLNNQLKAVLARSHGDVLVEGELSRFSRHGSGHWYFSLVEGPQKISCAMFRGNNRNMRWRPQDGVRVLCRGGVDVYGPRGTYSLIVRSMEPSGAGARALALEQLKRRLGAEGLFDPQRKRRLPTLPSAIGVATSATGAALQDILQVLGRRFPGMPVFLAPCTVQGEGAAQQIAAAIGLLNRHGGSDLIIVGRGGGSIEDLWAFNEEPVVRAVVGSRVPVISAVGHEIDTSLCDLAADRVAPTPSAAAELAVPRQADLVAHIVERQDRLVQAARRAVEERRRRVQQLRLMHPGQKVKLARRHAQEQEQRLQRSMARVMQRDRSRLQTQAARLDALSPLRVLQRGYSIVSHGGKAVVAASAVQPGDVVELRFAEGEAKAQVLGG